MSLRLPCRSMPCWGTSRPRSRGRRSRCWWRRPAPARHTAFRWLLQASPGPPARRSRAGAAPARRARRRRAHGQHPRRAGRRDRRLSRRFGSKSSRQTRIEVVTEGVFTRMILDDPGLDGVAAVLFDEFHERSLDADLGLALARDAQQGLREDLRLLVMSATLDGARYRQAAGRRAGDREPRPGVSGRDPLSRPRSGEAPSRTQVAEAVAAGAGADTGAVLAFLPGQGEIRRTEKRLREQVGRPHRRHRIRSTARSTPRSRTAPSRRRPPGSARWCWPPRSPRPPSPSRASAW